MTMSPSDVHALFRQGFPQPAQRELIRIAARAHAASSNLVRQAGYTGGQAHDVLPHVRRADFETRLSQMVTRGVTVREQRNHRGTSSFIELRGDGVVLTSLTRSKPPGRLPNAYYRDTLARGSQLNMLDMLGLESDEPSADAIYSVFVYGGRKGELSLGRIYFPLPNAKLHTIEPLDLLAEHDVLLETEEEAARPTEAAVEILMGLKKRTKEEGEGA